jgi:hypothetical protein
MIRSTIAVLSAAVLMAGCEGAKPAPPSGPLTTPPPPTVSADHGHSHDASGHPTEGPHHGVLVELGNEEYHAEVVHDDKAGSVTVYLLDGTAEKTATTDAADLAINVKHGDKPEQFKLAAQPVESDAKGTSSRFILVDKELVEHLDEKDSNATLQVTIGGTPFSGKIPAGGHAGHTHSHD